MAATRLTDARWQPDLDCSWSTSPGALTRCRGFVPTRKGGYATYRFEDSLATYVSTTEPLIAGITRKSDGTARFFIFNKASIYEFNSTTTAVDRSKGGGYSASTTNWTWTQFGDTTIATNLLNPVQYSSSGAFADLAGSPPKAQLIASNMGFVMLANINDGASKPDGWACCDIEDITDWTPTSVNQADAGRLYDTPGPIRALEPLRDSIVAYKDDSIYIAEYLGDLVTGIIWQWRLISDRVGASSPHGVCRINDMHYFIHRSGFYVFDGAAVRKIGRECTNFLFSTANGIGVDPTSAQVWYDARENLICFTWQAIGISGRDVQAFYNIETGKWSMGAGQTFTAGSGPTNYSTGIVKATQSDILAFDSTVDADNSSLVLIGLTAGANITANFLGVGAIGTVPVTSNMRTGAIGDGVTSVTLSYVRPRMFSYTVGSTTPTATFRADQNEMNATFSTSAPPETPDTSATASWNAEQLRFDGRASGKFVSADMTFSGTSMEMSGFYVDGIAAGTR